MTWFTPPDIVRDVTGFGERLRFAEVLLSRVKRAPEYQWINVGAPGAPALGSGWSQFVSSDGPANPVGYFKGRDGWMFLRGIVDCVAGATPTIFTLPLGYRPSFREVLTNRWGIIYQTGQPVPFRLDVLPTGEVQMLYRDDWQRGLVPVTDEAASGLSLDGLHFRSYVPTY